MYPAKLTDVSLFLSTKAVSVAVLKKSKAFLDTSGTANAATLVSKAFRSGNKTEMKQVANKA